MARFNSSQLAQLLGMAGYFRLGRTLSGKAPSAELTSALQCCVWLFTSGFDPVRLGSALGDQLQLFGSGFGSSQLGSALGE